MIFRAKTVLSAKLAKQLKNLERKPEQVTMNLVLDAVSGKCYPKKVKRK